tara:strand:+ start:1593 stop:1943 length:351 start_codon:yes stop_codon:yes gene_type:complete
MSSINKAFLMGNLTTTPTLGHTSSGGTAVTNFVLAINEVRKNSAGEKEKDTLFMECTAWGRNAEVICGHGTKGRLIHVDGRLQQSNWTDKETEQPRQSIKFVVERFTFIPDGRKSS